ncbi:aminoglycoside phosphotransferase family protein [Amnibacterium sp.]|uniref:aminoglycoside phosphotransferase family protein n=1 Tax=Amnibacterium sp. TaxID=1872496 RepID=UPI003F7BC3CC
MLIDEDLARALVAECFPAWSHLPIRQVLPGGWDNRTFRLGDDLAVRLPSAEGYVPAVEKEQRWLPSLAPQLPLPIPAPVAAGRPAAGYPWPWSVNRWLDGRSAAEAQVRDEVLFAQDLAAFLRALRAADASGGPVAGPHSFFRGGDLHVYEQETRDAIARLDDPALARWSGAVLERALASRWEEPPVWVHGDIADGNLLVADGRLSAVIDFGSSAVGDPACDLVIAWCRFDAGTAAVFRAAVGLDPATWDRAAGWALWKALITVDHPGSATTIARLREDLG